jgi:hypothetical protein
LGSNVRGRWWVVISVSMHHFVLSQMSSQSDSAGSEGHLSDGNVKKESEPEMKNDVKGKTSEKKKKRIRKNGKKNNQKKKTPPNSPSPMPP